MSNYKKLLKLLESFEPRVIVGNAKSMILRIGSVDDGIKESCYDVITRCVVVRSCKTSVLACSDDFGNC